MNIVLTCAIATALVVGCAAIIWKMAVYSQRPKRIPITATPPVPYEEVEFEGSSLVKGWLLYPIHASDGRTSDRDEEGLPSVAERWPVIVIAHGWSSNRSRVLRYARPLVEEGYAVLMYDVTCHGESGDIKGASALMFREDLLAAVQWIRSDDRLDHTRIGVLSHSLGALGTLLALDRDLQIRAIVTDSMPAKPFTMVSSELKRKGLPVFPLAYIIPRIWMYRAEISKAEYNALDITQTLQRNERRTTGRVAVCMVHSIGDTFIPHTELSDVLAGVSYEQAHLFVDTPGHSCSEQDEQFWEVVIPFFTRHMK